jgi:hypothetical protein
MGEAKALQRPLRGQAKEDVGKRHNQSQVFSEVHNFLR